MIPEPVSTFVKRALVRFQPRLAPLIPDRYFPIPYAGGRIYLNIKESPAMMARAVGRYEMAKHAVLRAILRPGGTFVDAGANKGDFTLVAARRVGPSGRVVAFEPEPENCRWIRRSVALNGYGNVTLHQAALGDAEGEVTLHLGNMSGWHTIVPGRRESKGSLTVPLRPLDAVLGGAPLDYLKVDVEGAEMAVLRGATGSLAASERAAVLVDVHPDMGVEAEEVCRFLEGLGFAIHAMALPVGAPLADRGRALEVLALKGWEARR